MLLFKKENSNSTHANMPFWVSLASDDSQPTPGVPDKYEGLEWQSCTGDQAQQRPSAFPSAGLQCWEVEV